MGTLRIEEFREAFEKAGDDVLLREGVFRCIVRPRISQMSHSERVQILSLVFENLSAETDRETISEGQKALARLFQEAKECYEKEEKSYSSGASLILMFFPLTWEDGSKVWEYLATHQINEYTKKSFPENLFTWAEKLSVPLPVRTMVACRTGQFDTITLLTFRYGWSTSLSDYNKVIKAMSRYLTESTNFQDRLEESDLTVESLAEKLAHENAYDPKMAPYIKLHELFYRRNKCLSKQKVKS